MTHRPTHRHTHVHVHIYPLVMTTSSTAQGGGGSFKNEKPIGEVSCCGAKMAERAHWWIERWLSVSPFLSLFLFLSLFFAIYLQSYLSSHLPRLHDLGAKPSSACCELRMLQRDRAQWITAADTPSCGQKKHTHAGPQRLPSADVPSCGQKRHTRWPATNSSACNELRMRQRDRVHWITAADTPSCGQKKHTRWPATTSKCWCAIMRSEKTHALACNEFFGVQMNHGCGSAIGYNEWHNPTSDATAVAKKKKRHSNTCLCVYVSICLSRHLFL